MNDIKEINTNIRDLIADIVSSTFIIDFGTITELIGNSVDLVEVSIGACVKPSEFTSFSCILCSTCSGNMTTKIDPKVGDKVVVLYPRRFSPQMLYTSKDEVVVDRDSVGYAYGKGLAFLAGQFFNNNETNKNLLHVTDDSIDFSTDKSTSININGATIVIGTEGNIDIKAKSGQKVTINGTHLEIS